MNSDEAAREIAGFIASLDRKVASLGRAAQISRSTVPVDGADVSVADGVAAGTEAAVVVEQVTVDMVDVQEQLDAAGEELSAAQEELEDRLTEAGERLDESAVRLEDAESRIDEAFGELATRPRIIFAATEPTGQALEGSIWFQVSESGTIIGQWQQTDPVGLETWEPREVASEVIANLDVGKLTAGSAEIPEIVAMRIASASGQFIELDVAQLIASDAVLGEAVAEKIWSDSTVTRLLTAEQIIGGSAIIDGSITARNLTLTPGNLVDDPGFSRPLGETWFTNTSAGVAIEANASLPGRGLHFTTTGYPVRSAPFPVVAGEEYALSYRATRYTRISFEWLDESGGSLGYSGPGVTDHEGFQDFTYTYTAPSAALQARAYVQFAGGGASEGWAGKPQFRPAVGASLIVDGAIDGKTITGSVVRTAASGTRMSMGPGTSGVHGIWLYDNAGIIRGSLTGTVAGDAAVFSLRDANDVQRMNLNETMLRFRASNGDDRTRLTDMGVQFYNNARVDFYGTVDRYGILERISGATGMSLWGGNGTSSTWARIDLRALSDGPAVYVQGVWDRTTTNPGNIRMSETYALYRSTSVKSAKIDVTDASSPDLLNVAYRSWLDKQEMIDAVLGRDADPGRRVVGAVAEEMEAVAPELCTYDSQGNLTGIAYERVALALIPFLRDLTNRVETLEGTEPTLWPVSPVYDDTALLDEVTAYGLEAMEEPLPTEPPVEVVDE